MVKRSTVNLTTRKQYVTICYRCFSEHNKTYHLVLQMWQPGRKEICTLICTLDCLESVRFPFGNTITLDINNMLRAYDRVNGLSESVLRTWGIFNFKPNERESKILMNRKVIKNDSSCTRGYWTFLLMPAGEKSISTTDGKTGRPGASL